MESALSVIGGVLELHGIFSTVVVVLSLLAAATLWLRGMLPVVLRLGVGLSTRKIAVFASGDALTSLQALLVDSELFDDANTLPIAGENDVGRAEKASIFLLYWPDWADDIDAVLRVKADHMALIVYAPPEHGRISQDAMARLSKKRNVVVNNFRGRLLNDIVSSLITTSYDKK